ncbi:MAG: hypothetical protein AB1716_06825 [Planctomycetota bacterium]
MSRPASLRAVGVLSAALWVTGAIHVASAAAPAQEPANAGQASRPASQTAASAPAQRVTVRRPNGAPAAHAAVYICARDPSGFNVEFMDGEPQKASYFAKTLCLPQRCDADGRFRFEPPDREYAVVVSDSEGCAEFKADDLEEDAVVTLRPWARVKGVLRRGKTVRPDVEVLLTVHGRSGHVRYQYKQKTDEDGRFAFDQVVPGRAGLEPWVTKRIIPARQEGTLHHSATRVTGAEYRCSVRLESGLTEVILGARGRPVIGRIILPQGENFDPNALADFPLLAGTPFEPDEDEATGGAPRELQAQSFQATMEPDGTFRFEHVPPGNWQLVGTFRLAGRDRERPAEVHYRFELEELPAARLAEPFDLGPVRAKVDVRLWR